MRSILFVATGGAIGSVFRYLLSVWLKPATHTFFPWHTFTANIIGCALIGICLSWFNADKITYETQLFITVGILGGFTTFSGFSAEMILMLQSKAFTQAMLYLLGSNITGLLAVYVGYTLINHLLA